MLDNSALLESIVSVGLSALVAYPVFKLLNPQRPAKNAVELGRKFLAWTVVMVIFNNLTPFWPIFDAIHLVKLAINAPIFGGLAFLAGWTFWKLRKPKGGRGFAGSIEGQEGKQAKEGAEKRDLEAIEEQAPNSPESAHNLGVNLFDNLFDNLEVNRDPWFRGGVAILGIVLVSVGASFFYDVFRPQVVKVGQPQVESAPAPAAPAPAAAPASTPAPQPVDTLSTVTPAWPAPDSTPGKNETEQERCEVKPVMTNHEIEVCRRSEAPPVLRRGNTGKR